MAAALRFERKLLRAGYTRVAGLDEVGRGSLAGPVVAAAVILPLTSRRRMQPLEGLEDSKALTLSARERLFSAILRASDAVAIGWATHHVVDRHGITTANRLAMVRALGALRQAPEVLLLDHFALPDCSLPQLPLTHGDSLSASIAAASIVAKVVRDRWMRHCESRFPGYGFAQHKGYGTPAHRKAIDQLGPCALHRRSFEPLTGLLA